jgi:poly-gamma-glutamate capsule biosynthesis protein CapA/YwtB (metallophosphatase superfamily)
MVAGAVALAASAALAIGGSASVATPPTSTAASGPGTASTPVKTAARLKPGWKGDGRPVTLAFGGDVHFEGVLGARLAADPRTALDGSVAALLSHSDLSMANFESALTDDGGCPDPQPKTYVFHAPPSAITAFRAAHVTLVTQANNHGEDCGLAGLRQSLAIEHTARYPVIGVGENAAQAYRPYRAVIDGQRIAIIAATQVIDADLVASWTASPSHPGVASAYQVPELVRAVQMARRTADTVVVYLHWGTETDTCPNAIQEPLARSLVRAGADIVIGTHAHVQVGGGYLGSALVDYGLGNFAFYDTTPPETYSGSLVVTVTGRHIDGYSWRPAEIQGGLPIPQSGAAAAASVARWRGLRSCTDLTAHAGAPLASRATETTPASQASAASPPSRRAPVVTLQSRRGASPGTTPAAAKQAGDG